MATRPKKAQLVSVLGPLLDTQVLDDENARRRQSRTFHASSIETCGRQQWYGLKGYTQDPAMDHPEWKRDAEAGNALHDIYQRDLLKLGLVVPTQEVLEYAGWRVEDYTLAGVVPLPEFANELPLPPNPYQIGGRIDSVIRYKDTLLVVDIKTVKQKAFDGMPGDFRFKKYYAQLQVYMHLSGIQYGLVLCISRNDSQKKEYLVTYSPEWCEVQFSRIAELKRMLDEDELPPAEADWFACGFCPFNELCSLNIGGKKNNES